MCVPVNTRCASRGRWVWPTSHAAEVARSALSQTTADQAERLGRLVAFSDPTRLRLLIAIHAAPDVWVSELADATELSPNTVSQALTALREAGLVSSRRDGRLSRWRLSDDAAHELLHHLGAPHTALHPPHG